MNKILEELVLMYPNAHCQLNYQNDYQLLIATILSAQSKDQIVNEVSAPLFKLYPDFKSLATGNLEEIENLIKKVGLSRTKTSNIIKTAQIINKKYHSKVPSEYQDLLDLPGVGRKVANVIRIELFNLVSFPVDTHVEKVLKRLGIAKEDMNVLEIEQMAYKIFDHAILKSLHHQLIFHGRQICIKRKPKCNICRINQYCQYYKNNRN